MKSGSLGLIAASLATLAVACQETPAPPAPAPSATPTAAPAHTASAAPTATATATAATPVPLPSGVRAVALPGAGPDGVGMDYLACDRATGRVFVPAGGTGSVDVIEQPDKVTRIEGFATATNERNGKKRVVGPSAATVGDGIVYVSSRADSKVCAIDAKTLQLGACLALESSPDGLAYVAATKELWVTTPKDKSIVVLDASTPALKPKSKFTLEGAPEGFAVDDAKGVFYTNLEDKDQTLRIDARTHKILSTWSPGCGAEGPRGLAIDKERGVLMVACVDHVVALDAAHDGKVLSKLDTGAGVDDLAYLQPQRALYAAAGKAARLTVARLEANGTLTSVAVVATVPGARNATVDAAGNAYVSDSAGGRILIVAPPPAGAAAAPTAAPAATPRH